MSNLLIELTRDQVIGLNRTALEKHKRTALMAMWFFLQNNAYSIRIEGTEVSDLMWGFATPPNQPRYSEEDAVQFVFDNILLPPFV